tara:strand:+ start:371 stop:529 length:159 start_codon:yes stop_codon:yes gene_type:complete
MNNNSKHVNVCMDVKLFDGLTELSKKNYRSRSSQVKKLIKEALDEDKLNDGG